jgi:phytoene dehydrogenase-like protein
MADIESLYKKEDGKILIEIKLSSVLQLFNSFDPAPFHEKELDTAAEHYIVDTVKDFPKKTQFKIKIYLPPDIATTERAQKIPQAIHNHFEYRMLVTDRKFRERFRHGRGSLIIGLTFLTVALLSRSLVSQLDNHFLAQLLADALLIIGWASMWEPVTVLLYELWPIIQQKKIYEKISRMEIQVIPLP